MPADDPKPADPADQVFIPRELIDATEDPENTNAGKFKYIDIEPRFNRKDLEELRERRRKWAARTNRSHKEFNVRKALQGGKETIAKLNTTPQHLKHLSETGLRRLTEAPNKIKNMPTAVRTQAQKLPGSLEKNLRENVPQEIRRTDEIDENTLPKTLLTILIGVITGVLATIVQFLGVTLLYTPKSQLVEEFVLDGDVLTGFIVHTVISCGMSVLAAILVVWVAPSATGAGFAEIKVSANGALYSRNTDDAKVLTVKVLGLSLVVGSGLAGARDFVHIGGLVASNVSNFWEEREKALNRKNLVFQSNKNRLMFLACGVSSAGAAAFRSPIGGVMWAFEEFSVFWSRETMSKCVMAAIAATCTAWYFVPSTGKVSDEMDLRGTYDLSVIRMDPLAHASGTDRSIRLWEVLTVIPIGVFGGLLGALFVMISGGYLAPLRKRVFVGPNSKVMRLVEIACVTVICSASVVLLPVFWPCRDMYESEIRAQQNNPHVHFRQFNCQAGQINELASLTFPAGFSVINNFFAPTNDLIFTPWTWFVYGSVFWVLTILAVGVTAPTGPFVHLILVGGAFGRCFGEILRRNVDSEVDVRVYAFLGILTLFVGFKRMALTMAAFFCELGGSIAVSPLMMLCAVITKIVGDQLTPSMTQFMCKFNNYPFLPEKGVYQQFRWFTAGDVMCEMRNGERTPPCVLGVLDTVKWCEQCLEKPHDTFPVINERGHDMLLCGLVRRSALIKAVQKHKPLGEEALINFGKTMELLPWVVQESAPANRVYKTFIKQGLRQLLVVRDGTRELVGIITRHDLHVCLSKWSANPGAEAKAANYDPSK